MVTLGLLVDSEIESKYLYDLAQWSEAQPNIRISHLVVHTRVPARVHERNRIVHTLRRAAVAAMTAAERLWFLKIGIYKDHLQCRDLTQVLSHSLRITPLPTDRPERCAYSDEDVSRLEALKLDLVLCCSATVPSGKALSAAKLGLVWLAYGDRGPAGFWDVYFKRDATGFEIRHLTGDGQERIVFTGRFATRYFYLLNQAFLCTMAQVYLKDLLNACGARGALPPAVAAAPRPNDAHGTPRLYQLAVYVTKTMAHLVRVRWNGLLKKQYRWSVAFARSDWKSLVMRDATRIPNPPNHFLADPFVVTEDGRDCCFIEDYDYGTHRGCIVVYELKNSAAERLGVALDEPFHLSFPYLFRFEGRLYMCPESCTAKEVRIYECIRFPFEWRLAKTALRGHGALDSMIFEHGGLWWLFTTFVREEVADGYSELRIFYSKTPLADRWQPHPKNPIYVDSTKGRNGGILFDDRAIYRVAQKQGFDTYGKGCSINRIVTLNPENFEEVKVRDIKADFFPGALGTHHLHSNGRVSVFDYAVRARTSPTD